MNILVAILVPWAVMSLLMAALWQVQRAKHNAGIVDIAWSFGTGLCAVWFAYVADGDPVRRAIIGAMAGLWGVRLGVHLFRRVMSESEDGRYEMLRERWGDRTQRNLFIFFQVQAFWAVLFALPMYVAAMNEADAPAWYDLLGIAIWLAAVVGESIADAQLARFRRDPSNKGKVCRVGLWRYSRHPNYFFEWIHWFAYFAMGLAGSFGWLTLAGPAIMLLFLFKITGIPPTEQRALKSRGDAYRQYQQTTSAFFPWPPKREHLPCPSSAE
jgi:steroid 5-alpha reductase family enzyme